MTFSTSGSEPAPEGAAEATAANGQVRELLRRARLTRAASQRLRAESRELRAARSDPYADDRRQPSR
jgi:hypothetical protein